MRGDKFVGRPCRRCGSTVRYVATRRCVGCMTRWIAQSIRNKVARELMRGKPCEICREPMKEPCFDEVDGTLRGWLCHHCNIGLGQFRDSVRSAAISD